MSHFARCCQSTQAVNQVHAGQSQSYAEESQASGTEHYFLGAVGLGSEQGSPWHHTLNVCGQDISFKIGMGMDVNVTDTPDRHQGYTSQTPGTDTKDTR